MFCLDDDGTVDTQRESGGGGVVVNISTKKLERFIWLFVKTKTKTKKEEKQTSTIGLIFFWGGQRTFFRKCSWVSITYQALRVSLRHLDGNHLPQQPQLPQLLVVPSGNFCVVRHVHAFAEGQG